MDLVDETAALVGVVGGGDERMLELGEPGLGGGELLVDGHYWVLSGWRVGVGP